MNSIDQINFKCNYTKKMDLKTCRENTVIVLVWNSRKTLEQVEGNKNQK